MSEDEGVLFLQWALPKMGYRWPGFRKPRNQVLKRIRNRMAELGLTGGYDEYREYLAENPLEWEQLERLCYVTISKFFRDRKVWDFLRDTILRNLMLETSSEPLHVWSIGCCNGEEPYSIAILIEQLSEQIKSNREVLILASDRTEEVLERAKKGEYPAGALSELTESELLKYFRSIEADQEQFKIKQAPANHVRFEKRNIRESLPKDSFQLIFCRNLVFTYYRKEHQEKFLQKLKPMLKPDGYLVIGSNEELPDTDWLVQVNRTQPIYQKISD
ncbi:MAG: protein-glutamate O-methyltransferase CheR [Balneolaceae bacterium]|nr:MAG: protein-glutamate O-methyltransferase CheR [Balneolaceae bacterium]